MSPDPLNLSDLGSALVIGSVTKAYFYTVVESGMALIAVNLPSLHVLSFSLKTGEILRSVRSIMDLSFLRSRSSDIEGNASGGIAPGDADTRGKAVPSTPTSSESSKVPHHDSTMYH